MTSDGYNGEVIKGSAGLIIPFATEGRYICHAEEAIAGVGTSVPCAHEGRLVSHLGFLASIPGTRFSFTYYFKMRGYYAAGDTYEIYVVADDPFTTPPSGHTLTQLIILSTWTSLSGSIIV